MTKHPVLRLVSLLLLTALLVACGGDAAEPDETPTVSTADGTSTASAAVTPAALAQTPTPESATLSPEQLQQIKPNELGWIPVLEYHYFTDHPDDLNRTPDQFRGDLQWLYDHDFYVVNVGDYLKDAMDVPAGKRPVMLTFDDSAVSQFDVKPLDNGQLQLQPDCAIAILETFFEGHPDFGRGGHFSLLPDRAFAWPDAWDQQEYTGEKLKWLLANGYELGNHTLEHANLGELSLEEIEYQLAEAELYTRQHFLPEARLDIVTLPYGGYPMDGDDSVFRGFDYKGEHFEYSAALLVGANPAYSPLSTEYDPYAVPRIQAFDAELRKWFGFIEDNPGIMYVSDGNPEVATVPNTLPDHLIDKLDETKLNGRTLIRY